MPVNQVGSLFKSRISSESVYLKEIRKNEYNFSGLCTFYIYSHRFWPIFQNNKSHYFLQDFVDGRAIEDEIRHEEDREVLVARIEQLQEAATAAKQQVTQHNI